jgi:hypothetical protein
LLGSKCDAVGTASRQQTASLRRAQANEIFTRRGKLEAVTRCDRMPTASATWRRPVAGKPRDISEERSDCGGAAMEPSH